GGVPHRIARDAAEVQVADADPGLAQAVRDGVRRKAGVVLPAREALLLCGRDQASVFEQTGGRVVVVGGDSENSRRHARLEQRVDERRDGARPREDDKETEQHEHQKERQEPVLLFLAQELQELREYATFAHGNSAFSTSVRNAGCRGSVVDTAAIRARRRGAWSTDPCR